MYIKLLFKFPDKNCTNLNLLILYSRTVWRAKSISQLNLLRRPEELGVYKYYIFILEYTRNVGGGGESHIYIYIYQRQRGSDLVILTISYPHYS